MAKVKKKYDIGHGVVVTDDGYQLLANWKHADGISSTSIGVKRPHVGPIPERVRALFSAGGEYFYLTDFTTPWGFWLGVKAWESREEMQAQQKPGIMGKEGVEMSKPDGTTYFREMMSFQWWSVEHETNERTLDSSDEMVKDYLCIQQSKDREEEKRFNEAIAFTGRDLKWIMERIGAWVPEEVPEPPALVLAD